MAGIEKILDRITGDAEAYSKKITEEAESKAGDIISDAEDEARNYIKNVRAESKKNGEDLLERAKASSVNEKRNILLRAKSELIDEAYCKAVMQLRALPDEEYKKILKKQIEDAIKDSGEEKYEIFSCHSDKDAVCGIISDYPNVTYGGIKDIDGGFILKRGNIELNCTLGSMVYSIRNEVEEEVRKLLLS